MKKTILAVSLTSLSFFIHAEMKPLVTGEMGNFKCASVMNPPRGIEKPPVTYNFEGDYYSQDMNFTIFQDEQRLKLTTALYSGVFFNVSSVNDTYNFVQVYGDGTDVAVISLKEKNVTYTNNGAHVNRLCTAEITFSKKL